MLVAERIERKRDGGVLAPAEWEQFLGGFASGEVADYQMAAMLMAVWFRGLGDSELRAWTRAMIDSGERLDFRDDGGPPAVDKHSTGGVGDKVSLVLAPLLASTGLRVPMMSGRGLGHTGGTLDKLEAIPGFRTGLPLEEFRRVLDEVGCAMIGQTERIAPLDGRLYALRDVTGTVPAIPLIASSIVSKKVAEGIGTLVLDVKFGGGAFLPGRDAALQLARTLVSLAGAEGLEAVALLTSMETPLGRAVGNALEVREALDCLEGGGPADLREVTLALGAEAVAAATGTDRRTAREELAGRLDDGSARERFLRLVEAQGGDPKVARDRDRLPVAPVRRVVEAAGAGVVEGVEARRIGLTAVGLGAGRRRVEDDVDPAVGLEILCGPGDRVAVGDTLAIVHARDESAAEEAAERVRRAVPIGEGDGLEGPAPLVWRRVTASGERET